MPTTVAFSYLNEVSCKGLKTASWGFFWNWLLIQITQKLLVIYTNDYANKGGSHYGINSIPRENADAN